MTEKIDRSDCKFRDYGYTAPREYGVFCNRNYTPTNVEKCDACVFYKKKNSEGDFDD